MCFWLSLFYYQYSTSGGGAQAESLIFRSGRLNFEQSASPLLSYLIKEYLHSIIQYWTVRRLIFEWVEKAVSISGKDFYSNLSISGAQFRAIGGFSYRRNGLGRR